MKILFVNLSGLRFNVTTPDTEPLGGTESALCYLSRQLACDGHEVHVVAHLPEGSVSVLAGVHHHAPQVLLNDAFLKAQDFDAIIVNNSPIAGSTLRLMAPRALFILWCHVVPDHPAMKDMAEPLVRESYDGMVYVSHWQKNVMEGHFKFTRPSVVIGNGFAPAFENMFASSAELLSAKQNRAAYTTTPFRGLHVLLDVMKVLPTATKLDLYSSMKVYQAAGDGQYAPLYAYAAENPRITRHQAVAQKTLPERLRSAAFFTYPSTYAETFCIAALEAVAAGMKVLTTATAALPEVFGPKADYVPVSIGDQPKLVADFRAMLEKNVIQFLVTPEQWSEQRFADLQEVNRTATWAQRARAWEEILCRWRCLETN